MDGLEFSEIFFSQVNHTSTFRVDSEYYQKEYLQLDQFIENNKHRFICINDLGLTVDASAFYPSLEPYYNTGTIPFIRVADVKDFIDYDNCIRIPEMGSEFNTLNLCYPGDIVLTKGGRVGSTGLITKKSYVTRDLIFLNSSILARMDYICLYLYFSSHFAFNLMLRSSSMTAQPHLTITLIKELPTFRFSFEFKKALVNVYEQCLYDRESSKTLYNNAEEIIEGLFGTDNTGFVKNKTMSIKSKSSSLDMSGRLDAEYYQPKYDLIESELNTEETIESMCNLYDENYQPDKDMSHQYIELANVDGFGGITDTDSIVGEELPTRARRIVKSGQVIVSSIEGSLQSCALITDEFDGAICSTGFYVVDSDKLNSETLLVLFKSEAIQALMKQRCSGTILTSINKDEFLSLPLPEIDKETQISISELVKESFALRRKSKQLLEDAKRAVEIAIEQDEESAIEWLKERQKEVGV